MKRVTRAMLAVAAAGCVATARAEEERLEEVVVEARQPVSAASSDDIGTRTFELRPHETMQDVLNNVPGLLVRQHQGGGKATQYLVRGFNADHGTDFLVTLDGLPVNLVTHGHGQGYADTNFVIPETLATLRLRKGPYFADLGDLAVAGALDLVTRETFDRPFFLAEGGSFDRMRYVAGGSPRLGGVKTLLAAQAYWSNGPFEHEENFARYNAYAKLTLEPAPRQRLWAAASGYAGDWDASGQIPQREVSARRLDRFGAIDPTEGGRSDRENVDVHWDWKASPVDAVSFQAYASRSALRLWSNFTFFQDTGRRFFEGPGGEVVDARGGPLPPGVRALPGDGIEQHDVRWLYGGRGSWTRAWELLVPLATTIGVETRHDDVDVAVYRQVRRERFFTTTKTHVVERSVGAHLSQQIYVTDWLRFDGGIRGDNFRFTVHDRLPRQPPDPDFGPVPIDGASSDSVVSPKANLILTPAPDTDVYLNFGTGFHSNDARGVVQAKQQGDTEFVPLARALGYEIGSRTRLFERLDLAAALWLLDLESEIVFCGDCGTIERDETGSFEAGGATRRWGIDLETRCQITRWLSADYDLSYADPRFENGDAVPIAPTLFMNGGLTVALANGFSAAWRARFLDDRPGTEDRSIPARGYFIMDLLAKYRWRNVEASLALLNLADFAWQEAVFVDTSCTRREAAGRGRCPSARDVHFTPGDPFGVRAGLKVFF